MSKEIGKVTVALSTATSDRPKASEHARLSKASTGGGNSYNPSIARCRKARRAQLSSLRVRHHDRHVALQIDFWYDKMAIVLGITSVFIITMVVLSECFDMREQQTDVIQAIRKFNSRYDIKYGDCLMVWNQHPDPLTVNCTSPAINTQTIAVNVHHADTDPDTNAYEYAYHSLNKDVHTNCPQVRPMPQWLKEKSCGLRKKREIDQKIEQICRPICVSSALPWTAWTAANGRRVRRRDILSVALDADWLACCQRMGWTIDAPIVECASHKNEL